MKYIRETMITGILPDGKKINKKLKWPLFYLNKSIEASQIGTRDSSQFAYLLDTNKIIKEIYSILKNIKFIKNKGEAGNPYYYYQSLINYIITNSKSNNPIKMIKFNNNQNIDFDYFDGNISSSILNKTDIPHIFVLEYSDNFITNKYKFLIFNYNNKKYKYILDSAVLRSNDKEHFTAYLTINKESYIFEGGNMNPIEKYEWKNLNEDNIPFKNDYEGEKKIFNFNNGYQLLFYYRYD